MRPPQSGFVHVGISERTLKLLKDVTRLPRRRRAGELQHGRRGCRGLEGLVLPARGEEDTGVSLASQQMTESQIDCLRTL
jgi:hypothetical protein